jgi:HD superfamily phosphohydrolase
MLTSKSSRNKYVMDSIYELIPVDKRLFQLIDTPEFQRLRSIKQLGTSYFCFPSATHTRFSHSMGTCHLAGQVFDQLVASDPSLDLRDSDRLVIQAAGLLHDVGHGPFSHLFENEIVPTLVGTDAGHHWNHEEQGLRVIDHLIDENHVDLFDTGQVKTIKAMITGELPGEHRFLRQIISNKDYGIDVDRMDYLRRDCHSVGLSCGYNPSVIMNYMRLMDGQLVHHVKRRAELFQFFHTRYSLYKQIYNHHITKAIEYMLVDAIIEANPYLELEKTLNDIDLYLTLTDSILDRIKTAPGLERSKSLLKRIDKRQFYKLVKTLPEKPTAADLAGVEQPIVQQVTVNYGTGRLNPLTRVPFYDDSGQIFNLKDFECRMLLPKRFEESEYRIFTRGGT